MDARISPEPTDEERQAILAAVSGPGTGRGHPAYDSPWRRAGLNHADREPWDRDRNGSAPVGNSVTSQP